METLLQLFAIFLIVTAGPAVVVLAASRSGNL
nr:hypothetical chloroplast RF12 [Gormaniella terricola]UWV18249.1 hypothetical chloroplast RF12 [Gormaniella terricola]